MLKISRERCVYCEEVIIESSKEHIIQNAIGGLYESEEICCSNCNNYLSSYIDAPFTKIFNPIIGNIENLKKTNNTKSQPSYEGVALHKGKVYKVVIKDNKVTSCPELSQELKRDISGLEFEILSNNFNMDNIAFENGISKIAFNFAIEKGICPNILKKGVNIEYKSKEISEISFQYEIIPFVALNPVDEYIEIDTKIELYHNLILFNQDNMLWCYVDLFNTFQYYVLLSDKWDKNELIYESYLQLVEKIDRSIPKINIRKPKHILNYAMLLDIEPSLDLEIFKNRIEESIKKESFKKEMADVISGKLGVDYLINFTKFKNDIDMLDLYKENNSLYFPNSMLEESNFRQKTYAGRVWGIRSYPLLIRELTNNGYDIRNYTFPKFERLNSYLLGHDS